VIVTPFHEDAEDDRATAIRDTLMVVRKFLIEHPEDTLDLAHPLTE